MSGENLALDTAHVARADAISEFGDDFDRAVLMLMVVMPKMAMKAAAPILSMIGCLRACPCLVALHLVLCGSGVQLQSGRQQNMTHVAFEKLGALPCLCIKYLCHVLFEGDNDLSARVCPSSLYSMSQAHLQPDGRPLHRLVRNALARRAQA